MSEHEQTERAARMALIEAKLREAFPDYKRYAPGAFNSYWGAIEGVSVRVGSPSMYGSSRWSIKIEGQPVRVKTQTVFVKDDNSFNVASLRKHIDASKHAKLDAEAAYKASEDYQRENNRQVSKFALPSSVKLVWKSCDTFELRYAKWMTDDEVKRFLDFIKAEKME